MSTLIARALVIGTALLALPRVVSSQVPKSNPVKDSFESFAGHYAGLLLAAFDSIPASRYTFKPSAPQQSVGYIAQHLEMANYGLCERIGDMKRTMTARDSLADTVKAMWPKDTLIVRLRASLYFCRDAFAKIDDSKMSDPVRFGPPGSSQTQPRVRALLYFVTDLAEHYAQLASYMRVMGMVPPSALPRPKQ